MHSIATVRLELLIQHSGAPPVVDAFLTSYRVIPPREKSE
jgi:hypothetical protein